jgi:hypothetical protein
MAIPTQFDDDMGAIETEVAGLIVMVRIMHRANARDLPKMKEQFRRRLESFVERISAFAQFMDGTGA